MKNKILTEKEYVARETLFCPVCKSESTNSEDVNRDGGRGTANCQCYTCGSYWVDIWHVVSYDNLNEGMSNKELKRVEKKAKDFQKKS
jgi:transcription elongation factor Elf1